MTIKTCAGCGKELRHHAKGYCVKCYHKYAVPPRRTGLCIDPLCPDKGKEVKIFSRRLCRKCYDRNKRRGTLDYYPLGKIVAVYND